MSGWGTPLGVTANCLTDVVELKYSRKTGSPETCTPGVDSRTLHLVKAPSSFTVLIRLAYCTWGIFRKVYRAEGNVIEQNVIV